MPNPTWTPSRLAAVRAAAQGLGGAATTVVDAVRGCGGVQAQDLDASRLAVRARSHGLTAADVAAACERDRTVVRTWAMRGTLHALAADDVRWTVALLGPGTATRYTKRRATLGLDDRLCAALLDAAPTVLADGPLTRAELVAAWNDHGVEVAAKGQAGAHAVLYAAARGVLCRGPERGDEPTYVLVAGGAGDAGPDPDPGGDGARLARRYLAAFGPADARDFQSWSGLPAAAARKAVDVAGDSTVRVGARTLQTVGEVPDPVSGWRLLPAFDTALLGHRERDALGTDDALASVFAGGGWIHPSVLHDGRVVGTWRWRPAIRPGPAIVALELVTGRADPAARTALTDQARDVARFFGGGEVELELA